MHGYFVLRETVEGQVSRLESIFSGLDIVSKDDYFTFSTLADAPNYSLAGSTFLGAATTKTFAGPPWEVMRENSLVYDFENDVVVNINSIKQRLVIGVAANYFVSTGLILPGSVKDDGSRVTDYSAWYHFDSNGFRYSEVISE